ncbi:hypothetical protein [Oceanisphaera sp.]|uniref:hypothetical protein n=1 Tax=Oceanisphaera sp. TaxID=1929979 RepID=UPI003A8EC1D9
MKRKQAMFHIKPLLATAILLPSLMFANASHAEIMPSIQKVKRDTLHCSSGRIAFESSKKNYERVQCEIKMKDGSSSKLTYSKNAEFTLSLYPNSNGQFTGTAYLVEGLRNALRLSGKDESLADRFSNLPYGNSQKATTIEGVDFHLPTQEGVLRYGNYIVTLYLL